MTDFPRRHALNPCLHCAIGQLVMFRVDHKVEEDAFEVAKCLVEAIADMCGSWDGADRAELVAHTRRLFERMLDEVEHHKWKGDGNARPNQKNH